jgi:dCTP diphosphatase
VSPLWWLVLARLLLSVTSHGVLSAPKRASLTKQPDTVATVTSERIRQALEEFVREREWAQFHTPANLAKSISIEAGELLECFQWNDDGDETRVRGELADVVTYCTLLAVRLGLDLDEIVLEKLVETREKYPVDLSKGRSAKYDAL